MRAHHSLGALAAVILAACGASPAAETTSEPTTAETRPTDPDPISPVGLAADHLRWTLAAAPANITMAQRAAMHLSRRVRNEGTETADAMHATATFTVNGAPSPALDLAFGNGARGSEWGALEPTHIVADDRQMGETLFPAPGDYVITMTTDGVTVDVMVHVDP